MTLRTNLKNSGGQTYWFYPLSNATNGKSVYATTESQKIKASDFGTTIKMPPTSAGLRTTKPAQSIAYLQLKAISSTTSKSAISRTVRDGRM